MIKHIVMWKLKDFAEGNSKKDNAQKIKSDLENLKSKIKEIEKMEVGINFNSSDCAFDAVLYSEFKNKEDLETYQKHPEHQAVSAFVGKIREDRKVVDYED
jgi:hypothetical protein